MKNLILYGPQNLSNKKFVSSEADEIRGYRGGIQKINNSRFSGSTVVDKKVADKDAVIQGAIRATSSLSLESVINEYSRYLNKPDRYFRESVNYHVFTPMTSYVGWQTQGDTTIRSFDTEVFQYGDGSIKFDADVSEANNYAGIYTEQAELFDLGVYDNEGNFELWIYLPQTAGVESVELSIGNDSSNYYNDTETEQYDNESFEAGWNYVSFRLEDMSETGTPDPYTFGEYISVKVNYNGEMEDRETFRLGGVLWQQESRTRNFRAYVENLDISSRHYDISRAQATLSLLLYEGIAESTGEFSVYASANNTTATITGDFTLNGTYTPLPIITIDINSATNVSSITLTNLTVGDSVEIENSFAAGDKLIIDTDSRQVTVNGSSVDYSDVLPRFELGENEIQISIATTSEETIEETVQDSNLTGTV